MVVLMELCGPMKVSKKMNNSEKRERGLKLATYEESLRSVACNIIGANIIILLAVYFGANNTALGIISSASYFTGVLIPFVLKFLNGKSLIKSLSWVWLLSGLISIGYLALFYTEGSVAIGILLFCYIMCLMFRIIGSPLWEYLLKLLSTSKTAGKVIGKVSNTFQISSLVTQLALVLLMEVKFFSTLQGLVLLLMVGVLFQVVSFFPLIRIPLDQTLSYNAGEGVLKTFLVAMKQSELRKYLALRWLLLQVTIIFAMMVPFMKVVLNVQESIIFIYSAIISASYIIAGNINKYLADRFGSKPLMLLSTSVLLLSTLAMCFYHESLGSFWFIGLAIILSFLVQLCNMLIQRLYTKVIPNQGAIAFNSMFFFVLAIMSLATGLLNGKLIDLGTSYPIFANSYSLVFFFALTLILICLFITFRIKELGSVKTGEVAKVLFSINDLQTIKKVDQLSGLNNKLKRKKILMEIGYNHTNIAKDKMHEILASSFSFDTYEILRSLSDKPNKAMIGDLIALAEDDDSFVQLEAVNALSSYPNNDCVTETLTKLLNARWASIRSMAARSLAIITGPNEELLQRVNALSQNAVHIDEVINYLIAKSFLDKDAEYLVSIFDLQYIVRSATYKKTRYTVIAFLLGLEYDLLISLFNCANHPQSALSLLSSSLNLDKKCNSYNFTELVNNDGLAQLVEGVVAQVPEQTQTEYKALKQGLLKFNKTSPLYEAVDYLAILYFALSLMVE